MSTVKSIQALNKRELENVVPPSASWHTDYRDTAYVFVGGLSFDLSEGDIETIFSQFGIPTWIKLARDKETGKSRGFGWLKYEDQRSCDLAVDNLGGAQILGRTLRVDHTRYTKKDGDEEEDEKYNIRFDAPVKSQGQNPDSDSDEASKLRRPKTKAEKELEALIRNHDDDDPMKEYLVNQKREEVAAEAKMLDGPKRDRHHHRHRRERRRDGRSPGEDTRKRHNRSQERSRRSDSPDRSRRHGSRDRRHRSTSRDRDGAARHRR